MANYAGAVAAMRSRFSTAWTETPIAYQNETPQDGSGVAIEPWPPDGPWAYFEVMSTVADIRGAGLPGNQVWLTRGYIHAHIFTPLGYGLPEALRLAEAAGEIFRSATFYQDGQGSKVLCMAPQIDGGGSGDDEGNWFRVTCAIPFEFYFRK